MLSVFRYIAFHTPVKFVQLIKENVMGRVKQLAMDEFEKYLATREKQMKLDFAENDQDIAQYHAEFNAWLDAYEKSFGESGKGERA